MLFALTRINSHLAESYNQAQIDVTNRDRAARAAQAAAATAQTSYQAAHAKFVTMIRAEYEGSSLGAAGALLDSTSYSDYMTRLEGASLVSAHTAQVVADMSTARHDATVQADQAQRLLAAAAHERDVMSKARDAMQTQIVVYKRLLGSLSSAQLSSFQQAFDSLPSATAIPLPSAPNDAARRAVAYALAQVGKPYVFGAAGPASFDCSGLTMMAWRAGGVSLPHLAAAQFQYGIHVPADQLQPGDLLFFYPPGIDHVTIYIGNGLMVSAPTEGQNVSVVALRTFASDYIGAVRLP